MTDSKLEPKVFKIKLPMRIRTSSKKQQALNLNVYRNLHFRSLSSQKNKFAKIAKKLLRNIPPLGVITLHYEVYPQSKRRLDIMNVGSIIDKYFSDTLTAMGIIEDDDYTHIPIVSFAFGGLVKKEYLLVTITEIEPRKEAKPMRVLLDQSDIQKALTAYVSNLNIPNAIGIRLMSNAEGLIEAEVLFDLVEDILNGKTNEHDAIPPEEEAPKKRSRGGRPRGSKNKPKEDDANVDEDISTGADGSSGGTDTASESEDTPETTTLPEDDNDELKSKGTKKENLFGDKDDSSSEDDDKAEATLDTTPETPVKKKGSIFDA